MSGVLELRQRAEYTHKQNRMSGRHGWLRLTPAYSLKIVEEIIGAYDSPMRIYDPFCGTATTALSAAYHGHHGITSDINPFLVWLAKAKMAHYSQEVIASTRRLAIDLLKKLESGAQVENPLPPIHNIERWWSARTLTFLSGLRAAIEASAAPDSPEGALMLVAFCRTLIGVSAVSFNHQSMSFKDSHQLAFPDSTDLPAAFLADLDFVLAGASLNPVGFSDVLLGDSRNTASMVQEKVDRVITSPPYANRMSYIRELRPYMYWLGWLFHAREAGELDWKAIGGTWGIATSRLTDWNGQTAGFHSALLEKAVASIQRPENKNGRLLAKYVHRYFVDMWSHFQGLLPVLRRGAQLHYIVGNSSFYGELLPVEQIYAEMLSELGFREVGCRAIRKRNSKKELVEFAVTGTWG